jgi:oxygen-dependent protoporphyrinogen oxidase
MGDGATSPRVPRRVVVVGGGITGLAAAHRLLEIARERSLPLELTLLEGSSRLGGVIGTERRDGFALEWGPDSFITDKPWALDLTRRLGLEGELIGTTSTHRRSFVVRNGRLLPVPEGFQLLAPSRLWPFVVSPIFSWPGKLRMGLDWFLPARREESDESLASFVERRLGREALERMAQPMIAGIYGADPRTLSLRATMPRFIEMERTHGSVIRGMVARRKGSGNHHRGTETRRRASGVPGEPRPGNDLKAGTQQESAGGVSGARYSLFMSFRDGMQTLVDALVSRLPQECIRAGAFVSRLSRTSDGRWRITLGGRDAEVGSTVEADAVCLALPSYAAGRLLEELDQSLAQELCGISYGSSATVNLAYRREAIPHSLDGFGFVAPAMERRSILGCTFSSVKFAGRAPAGHALLRAFLGGETLSEMNDDEAEAAVRADLKELLGVSTPPLFSLIRRQERAMAQYQVGHLDRVAAIQASAARYPGLALAGNAYQGIGIPDCVHSGELAAERLLSSG